MMPRSSIIKLFLLITVSCSIVLHAQNQLRIGGASTGASGVPHGLEIQVAQQGTKLNDMDTNINRRLDDLGRKMDDMGKTTDGLKTDVAKLGVLSSMFTFGISTVVTIMFTVLLSVPLTFIVQYLLKRRFPGTAG